MRAESHAMLVLRNSLLHAAVEFQWEAISATLCAVFNRPAQWVGVVPW